MTTATIEKPTETATDAAFTVTASAFRSIIEAVAPAAKTPYFGSVVEITAEGDTLSARCGDLTQGIVATIGGVRMERGFLVRDVSAAAPGACYVAHDALHDLLRRCEGELRCVAAEKALTVSGPGVEAEVRRLPFGEDRFPLVPPPAADHWIEVAAGDLRRAIGRVAHAAADGDSRPTLTAVKIEATAEVLTLAAADGFRLAIAHVPVVAASWRETPHVLPPATTVRTLARLLAAVDPSATVRLALSANGNVLHAAAPGRSWRSVLLDGAFADFRQFASKAFATTITADRKDLAAAVAAARPFAHKHTAMGGPATYLLALDGAAPLTVTGSDADRGRVARTIPAELVGDPMPFKVNAAYLADALAARDGEKVVLALNSPEQALAITEPDTEDVEIVMPMVGK